MPGNKESNDTGNKPGIPMGMATLALNKAKLAAKPQVAKDRNRKLLEMGVSGFVFAIAKRNRIQNPKTPRKWG